jgi:protein-S-isoprenylcysteine O-methyltransferase Ste14
VGQGDLNLRFRIALGVLLAAVILVRVGPQLRSLQPVEKRRLESGWNVAIRSLVGLAGFTLLFIYLLKPEWLAWAALPIPGAVRWLGLAAGAAGTAGLILVHRELGRNFSATLEIRAGQMLVTSGPYRWVRHPMYTTLFLVMFSSFLLSANWLIGALWIGGFTAVVVTRLPNEEAAMEAAFGDRFRAWGDHTGRLLPKLRKPKLRRQT